MADDVPDEEADTGAGERDDVVPVSADVGFGGQIAVSDLHGVLVGQIVRQQAALEGQDHGAFARVAPGVVDGQGGTAGEFQAQRAVVVTEGGGVLRTVEAGDAQDHAAGHQGDRDEGVDLGEQPFGVLGVLGEPARSGLQIRLQHRLPAGQTAYLRRGRAEVDLLADRAEGKVVADPVHHRAVQVGAGVGGLLATQYGLGQVDGDEVGQSWDRRLGEFLGGTAHVQGGTYAGAGLGQQLQAAARGQGVRPHARFPHHHEPSCCPGRGVGVIVRHVNPVDGAERAVGDVGKVPGQRGDGQTPGGRRGRNEPGRRDGGDNGEPTGTARRYVDLGRDGEGLSRCGAGQDGLDGNAFHP